MELKRRKFAPEILANSEFVDHLNVSEKLDWFNFGVFVFVGGLVTLTKFPETASQDSTPSNFIFSIHHSDPGFEDDPETRSFRGLSADKMRVNRSQLARKT